MSPATAPAYDKSGGFAAWTQLWSVGAQVGEGREAWVFIFSAQELGLLSGEAPGDCALGLENTNLPLFPAAPAVVPFSSGKFLGLLNVPHLTSK